MPPLHLLLGSNIGDRAAWLANARVWIEAGVGTIRAASAVYETAAWGKEEQAAFLNQALAVEVHATLTEGLGVDEAARAILAKTSAIEAGAGRERTETWAPRTLDIDLLLWGDAVVDLLELKIPHRALPGRRFALVPLAEIAGDMVHPVQGKTVAELLEECRDALAVSVFADESWDEISALPNGRSVVSGMSLASPSPSEFRGSAKNLHDGTNNPPDSTITSGSRTVTPLRHGEGPGVRLSLFGRLPPRHLAIEGVIGAGKTTLAGRLAAHYGVTPILEAFTENAFLARFYAEPQRYALPVELHFLTDRHRQLLEAAAESTPPLVTDYTFAKCRLFANITLPAEEAALFNRLYAMAEAVLPRPDVLIYLDAPVARLQQSIRQRGREYEQGIRDEYLASLAAAYEAWLPESGLPVVWVDTARIDYLGDARAMDALVEIVESPLAAGVHALVV